jgi:hypothetical protein
MKILDKIKEWFLFSSSKLRYSENTPLSDRIVKYLAYYGRGDASQISVFFVVRIKEIETELQELQAKKIIRPCKKQIDPLMISYELS